MSARYRTRRAAALVIVAAMFVVSVHAHAGAQLRFVASNGNDSFTPCCNM